MISRKLDCGCRLSATAGAFAFALGRVGYEPTPKDPEGLQGLADAVFGFCCLGFGAVGILLG
jgi:hypothetical protein